MKQNDYILVSVVIVISAVFSIVLSNVLISKPQNRQQEVEVVTPITADFPLPDKKYFSDKSINPTQLIRIGDSSNKKPFNDGN